jgi:hypothetical protein
MVAKADSDSDSDSNTFRLQNDEPCWTTHALSSTVSTSDSINTDHVDGTAPFSDIKMLESLEVLPAWNPAFDDGSPFSDSQEEPLRAITFVLTTPPGTFQPSSLQQPTRQRHGMMIRPARLSGGSGEK